MPAIQKFLGGVIAIGLVTTLILPKRQTVQVINAVSGLVRGSLATAMASKRQ
ncbi:hypothetical protein [Actinomadura geliboluensis]|uniref:hypothetical protein n=1 Tax=Actinomadura geliboluensis TaxID=882440 RepID=UPI0026382218|nr:hypothetical protein [Actinomadura geliboluensis]